MSLQAAAADQPAASPFATPEPTSKPRRGRSKLAKNVVPDSESSGDEIHVATPPTRKASFKGVYVPVPKTSSPRDVKSSSNASKSPSIADTNASAEYETPATSAMTTPAMNPPKISASARALELRMSANALGTRSASKKRKIAEDHTYEQEVDSDAILAARLQAEEYEEADSMSLDESEYEPRSKRRRRGSSNEPIMLESDDDDDDIPLAMSRRAAARNTVRKSSIPASESSALSSIRSSLGSSEFSDGTVTSASSDNEGDDEPPVRAIPTRSKRRRGSQKHMTRTERERAKLEKAHPEIKTMWDDLRNISPIKPVGGEQPESITRKLKSFQLEGVDWMRKQEQSVWRGGLLGDEMGMGKTIQAVSLIMSDYPAKAPCLVVVPPWP